MLLTIILQLAVPAPDIVFHAEIRAREIEVEQSGTATLAATADPDGGSIVKIERPRGRSLRNARIAAHAEARLDRSAPNRENP